ncbi:TatD family hydrolase [Candidatus Omnitrophota bacterium]
MRLVDTHCHLDFPDYKDDLSEVLERAAASGVVRMIVPGTSLTSSEEAVRLAGENPAVFAAVGIHPHEADKVDSSGVSRLKDMAIASDKVVAIGEIGLDYYRKHSKPANQRRLFRNCLEIAKDLDLPVILHTREAREDFLRILEDSSPPAARGVVHCFSADAGFLEELLALGMHISFTGNITFEKASALHEVIKRVPLERLLMETDSPFIAPVPFRGKRNEPAYMNQFLEVYANIYGLAPEDIARITTHNANRLFGLGIEDPAVVAYPIRDALYLNITNRCTNACTFCTRKYSNYVKGHNLKLDAEPTAREIIEAMPDVSAYREVVFCGYGEPTLRLETLKRVASFIKQKGGTVRLTSNGEGNLINSRSIAAELKGLVDRVSVSLNAPDATGYDRLCQSVFGEAAYDAILDFIAECAKQGMEVEVTCLDMIGESAVSACRQKAEQLGARFRLRHLDVVG